MCIPCFPCWGFTFNICSHLLSVSHTSVHFTSPYTHLAITLFNTITVITVYSMYVHVRQYRTYSAYECTLRTVVPSFSRLDPSSKECLICRSTKWGLCRIHEVSIRCHSLKIWGKTNLDWIKSRKILKEILRYCVCSFSRFLWVLTSANIQYILYSSTDTFIQSAW
jgi:hypothetical protein